MENREETAFYSFGC